MYGTIGHLRVKAGMEETFLQLLKNQAEAFEDGHIAGLVGSYMYRLEARQNAYAMVALVEDREAYWKHAQSAGQDARYRQWLPLLIGEPTWHDGEVVGGSVLPRSVKSEGRGRTWTP